MQSVTEMFISTENPGEVQKQVRPEADALVQTHIVGLMSALKTSDEASLSTR